MGAAGTAASLAVFAGPLLVVQLVRYFGCLPCQQGLIDLDRAAHEITLLGAVAVAVGGSADYQARWLRHERGVKIPLLLDPAQRLRAARR
jgi:peroxiredoxin